MDSPLRDMKKKKCCNHEWEGNINFGCSKGYNCECHRMSLQKESEWELKLQEKIKENKFVTPSSHLDVEEIKSFIRETLSNREKEIAEEVAVTFAKSPLNKRKDKDADAFYLDVLQIIKR